MDRLERNGVSLATVRWRESPLWLRILGVVVLANFFSFVAGALWLGGDALNGTASRGHYYLRGHGQAHEVTAAVFRYSLIHAITAATGILLLIAGVIAHNWSRPR
jgi:hypothetical protein